MSTTVVVTGSKSGIGKGLLASYASRSNHIVVAAIRDGLDSEAGKALLSLPVGSGSKIIVKKYDASSTSAATGLVEELESKDGLTKLDIVVANAGILKTMENVAGTSAEDFTEHFNINALSPILLYQATAALLNKSKQTPKFLVVSTRLASIGLQSSLPLPLAAYNVSKAAVNLAVARIHADEPKIVALPVHPGFVATNMGNRAVAKLGIDPNSDQNPAISVDESVAGMLKVFDNATKENESGKFIGYDGEEDTVVGC